MAGNVIELPDLVLSKQCVLESKETSEGCEGSGKEFTNYQHNF